MPLVGERVWNPAGSEPSMKRFEPTRRSVLGLAGLATASLPCPKRLSKLRKLPAAAGLT